MPRTKRPTKRKSEEHDDFTKTLNTILQEERKNVELKAKMTYREIELAFRILTDSFTSETLQRTVGELKNELFLQEINIHPNEEGRVRSRTDDGYMTQNSSQSSEGRSASRMRAPPSVAKTSRRSRSADASSRKPSVRLASTQKRRSRSAYKTPIYKNIPSYPPITPKVAPDTALTVLRQPRQGEMVLSLTGSPVMVPTCYTMQPDEKANCNILLRDGTMLSLQPKHLRQSQDYIPFALMDEKVLHQLKTLKDNLDTVVKLGEQVHS